MNKLSQKLGLSEKLSKNFFAIIVVAFGGAIIYGLPYFRYDYYDAYLEVYNLTGCIRKYPGCIWYDILFIRRYSGRQIFNQDHTYRFSHRNRSGRICTSAAAQLYSAAVPVRFLGHKLFVCVLAMLR